MTQSQERPALEYIEFVKALARAAEARDYRESAAERSPQSGGIFTDDIQNGSLAGRCSQ